MLRLSRLTLFTLLLALCAGYCPAEETMRKSELIGIPIKSVVFGNSHGVVHTSPTGEPGMFYIPYYSTTGSALLGYNPQTDEAVEVKLGSSGGYGCCVGSDGALYIGGVGPGNMYRYDPATGELINVGGSKTGATYIWATAASEDGKVYGACYPTCNVIEYDIATRTLTDLGRMDDKEKYCRSICVAQDGKVWVGIGTHARLVVLDPKSGERTNVLPEKYRAGSSCYDLGVSGKYVFASIIRHPYTLLVFDAETQQVVADLGAAPDSVWWMNTKGAAPGEAYLYSLPNGDLYHYNVATGKLTLKAESLGQCDRVIDDRYVHGINDQDYFLYDLQEGKYLSRRKLSEAGEGMAVYTLTAASDGNLYGSTYINQHIFRYDVQNDELTDLGKVIRVGGQVDSIHNGHDGKVYLGAYVMANVAIYDPAQPWRPGREPGSNPLELGAVGHGQYRTQSIALGPEGNIWVGSIPSYNSAPTGALTRWNHVNGDKKTWTDLVPGGAVSDITVDDRYVYCAGGGKFFVMDPKTDTKVYEEARGVSALVTAAGGQIVGSSGEEVFVFDPAEMKVTKTVPSPIGSMDYMTVAPNGRIYGINGSAVGQIDPATWQGAKIAQEGGKFLAADADSTLYFARGSQLYRLK